MQYVAIDIETTGLHKNCSVLELAMVLEDTSKSTPVEDLPYFHMLFQPGRFVGEATAIELHRDSGLLEEAQKKGLWSHEVWSAAESWLRGHGSEKWNAAGKNVAGFDLQFFPESLREMFRHRVIDPGSVFLDWSKDKAPSLGDIKEELGMDSTIKHRALEDARDVVRVLRKSWARVPGAISATSMHDKRLRGMAVPLT